MPTSVDAVTAGLEAVEAHALVGHEVVEDADRVRAATDACDDGVRQPAEKLQALFARLTADDRGEVADHSGERVRATDRADDVVRVVDVGHPVAERLVHG